MNRKITTAIVVVLALILLYNIGKNTPKGKTLAIADYMYNIIDDLGRSSELLQDGKREESKAAAMSAYRKCEEFGNFEAPAELQDTLREFYTAVRYASISLYNYADTGDKNELEIALMRTKDAQAASSKALEEMQEYAKENRLL